MTSTVSPHYWGAAAIRASAGGKIAVPVSPANVIYSHFKNVSGVAAPDGSAGVSINKLKILDVMIERLRQMRRHKINFENTPESADASKRLDILIEQVKKQIDIQSAAAGASAPYKPASAQPAAGSFFSVTA
ncbi:MAG: hypothetical protein LBC53_03375 [Spirochaetaceae bacterium]|jgi:hypothetical protein|nr:hypothetical protein [Spirochaetaceae bacterium]